MSEGDLGFNKIAAAILATALGFMLLKEVSHSAMHVKAPAKPVYFVGDISPVGSESGTPEELPFPQESWIAAMDAASGQTAFGACTSCHTIEKGGGTLTGPNLWNIVGQPSASVDGFAYSGAMKSANVIWDYEALDAYLTKPGRYIKGNAMTFIGIKQEGRRAAVIEYLRVNADNPLDRPTAAVMEAESMEAMEKPMAQDEASTDGEAIKMIDGSVEKMDKTMEDAKKMDKTMEDVKDLMDEKIGTIKDLPGKDGN